MRRVILFAAALAALCPFASAQQTSTSSVEREAYEDRMSQTLRQLRQQIDFAARQAPQADQPRYSPMYDSLSQAEQAFAAFKTASSVDLAGARAAAERSVNKALRDWAQFRISAPQNPASDANSRMVTEGAQ